MSNVDNKAFESLFSRRTRDTIKPGLTRVQAAFSHLNQPSLSTPCVLVGGTNGKGSTSGFLWGLLNSSLERVGLYTSPHLIDFAERMQCSHRSVTNGDLLDLWSKLQRGLPAEVYEPLSFFELTTLMAFQLFQKEQCQFNVWEVGMGGRWDATNVMDPLASVIVSVSLDHQEFLGTDLESITREKLGILRPGRPLFVGSGGWLWKDEKAAGLVRETAREKGCPLYCFGKDFAVDGSEVDIHLPDFPFVKISLPEFIQATFLQENFALAAAIYHWLQQSRPDIALLPVREAALSQFQKNKRVPASLVGRFWWTQVQIAENQTQSLLFDVCHNVNGVEEMLRALRAQGFQPKDRVPALVSILRDKNCAGMLDLLQSFFGPIMLFKTTSDRSFQQNDLPPRHQQLRMFDSFSEAFAAAQKEWRPTSTPWVVCGSVLAVGQAIESLAVFPKDLTKKSLGSML